MLLNESKLKFLLKRNNPNNLSEMFYTKTSNCIQEAIVKSEQLNSI